MNVAIHSRSSPPPPSLDAYHPRRPPMLLPIPSHSSVSLLCNPQTLLSQFLKRERRKKRKLLLLFFLLAFASAPDAPPHDRPMPGSSTNLLDEGEELLAGLGVVPEDPEHGGGGRLRVDFLDASHHHTHVAVGREEVGR